MRQAIGFHSPEVLAALDGNPRPRPSATNSEDVAKWDQANGDNLSILYFATEGLAHTTNRLLQQDPLETERQRGRRSLID